MALWYNGMMALHKTTIHLPEDVYNSLRLEAYNKKTSISKLIVKALTRISEPIIKSQVLKAVLDHEPVKPIKTSKEYHRPFDICPKHKTFYKSCGD